MCQPCEHNQAPQHWKGLSTQGYLSNFSIAQTAGHLEAWQRSTNCEGPQRYRQTTSTPKALADGSKWRRGVIIVRLSAAERRTKAWNKALGHKQSRLRTWPNVEHYRVAGPQPNAHSASTWCVLNAQRTRRCNMLRALGPRTWRCKLLRARVPTHKALRYVAGEKPNAQGAATCCELKA